MNFQDYGNCLLLNSLGVVGLHLELFRVLENSLHVPRINYS